MHLNGFHARWQILFKIHIHVRNNMNYWIRISPRLQWVLPCVSVTLSTIISLVGLIYPAAFVSSMLYHELSEMVETGPEHKYPASVGGSWKHSADLQISVPSSALLFITRSFVAIHLCYIKSQELRNLAANKAKRRRQFNFWRRLIGNYAWNLKGFPIISSSN